MVRWIETKWACFQVGHKERFEERRMGMTYSNYAYYCADVDELKTKLETLTQMCRESQFEIKAAIPLTETLTFSFSDGSRTDGITHTNGFAVIMQRFEEVSQEVYDQRVSAVNLARDAKNKIPQLKLAIEKQGAEIQRLEGTLSEAKQVAEDEIRPDKGLLGGNKFNLGWRTFETQQKAEAAKRAAAIDVESLTAQITRLTRERDAATSELNSLLAIQ